MPYNTLPSTPGSTSLSNIASPPLKSTPNSPHIRSPSISNNYHPYLIQTTSSSLLTRSNSSPSQPIADMRHKPSRSMSSLAASASEGELDKVAIGSKEERERRRKSMESPLNRPGMRRSGTLPAFPRVDEVTPVKGMGLPMDPKMWSPSELARYLKETLRTGGPDGTGQILPAPLIKDIETWVLRQQVNGKAFLKGNQESWTSSSRPPPFLPLLLSISRRLRRSSLQSRLSSETSSFSPSPLNPDSPMVGSILFEEDEDNSAEELSPISGVKRMANKYESHSGEDPEPLKPQWTGGSSTSEVFRRWEDIGNGPRRKRRESDRSLGSLADEEISPPRITNALSESGDEGDQVEEDVATLKAPPAGLGLGIGMDGGKGKQISPPPPYRSPNPDESPDTTLEETPSRTRLSVTPTPEHPTETHSTQPGSNYGPLSTSSPRSRRRMPTELSLKPESEHGSRKATIRPNRIESIFAPPSPPVKSPREAELEEQLNALLVRVRELENALIPPKASPIAATFADSVMARFGLIPEREGLPTRVRELPGYLFLVGVGVGAVVVRAFMRRR